MVSRVLRWLSVAVAACPVVAAEDKTLYKLANGECGEASLDKRLTIIVNAVAALQEGACKDHGYTVPSGRQDLAIGSNTISVALFKKAKVIDFSQMLGLGNLLMGVHEPGPTSQRATAAAQGTVLLHKIIDEKIGQCGQAAINKSYVEIAKLVGLQEGTCEDHGYGISQGSKDVDVPGISTVSFSLYKKAGALGVADVLSFIISGDMVSMHKIHDPVCSEVTVEKKYATEIASFASMKEGTCNQNGYSIKGGKQDLILPLIGEVDITLYGKFGADVAV
jgi:hypothetical protein